MMLKMLFVGSLAWIGYVIMKENQTRKPVALISAPNRMGRRNPSSERHNF